LEIAEFAVNNKTHSVTKILQFVVNDRRELRMKTDIRKKKSGEGSIACGKNKECSREG